MAIYDLLKLKIKSGKYDKEDMMQKLDVYLLKGRISIDQYNELVEMMEA